MTDEDIADIVYIEPLTVEFLTRIHRKRTSRRTPADTRRTDWPQSGRRTGGCRGFGKYNVRVLGTPIQTIRNAEDRELFQATPS